MIGYYYDPPLDLSSHSNWKQNIVYFKLIEKKDALFIPIHFEELFILDDKEKFGYWINQWNNPQALDLNNFCLNFIFQLPELKALINNIYNFKLGQHHKLLENAHNCVKLYKFRLNNNHLVPETENSSAPSEEYMERNLKRKEQSIIDLNTSILNYKRNCLLLIKQISEIVEKKFKNTLDPLFLHINLQLSKVYFSQSGCFTFFKENRKYNNSFFNQHKNLFEAISIRVFTPEIKSKKNYLVNYNCISTLNNLN